MPAMIGDETDVPPNPAHVTGSTRAGRSAILPGLNSRPHSSDPRRRWRRTATRREYRARRRSGCRTNRIAMSVWHIQRRYRLRHRFSTALPWRSRSGRRCPRWYSGSHCRPSCCRSRSSRRFDRSLRSRRSARWRTNSSRGFPERKRVPSHKSSRSSRSNKCCSCPRTCRRNRCRPPTRHTASR